ncbi:SRPBCC domain-containing protein [Phenylobacterium sp.]|uniref:SRPBCC family protein n=1 Tax=Phenylobacterium sp. TaxID=1871053 RepID=UPI00301B936C
MSPRAMQTFHHTLDIDAPATEVWRVLTNPELVREWASAYADGLSIRTSWREGDAVAWKEPNGATRAAGRVAAFEPGRRLSFEYDAGRVAPEGRSFCETFEISEVDHRTRLDFITGPLDDIGAAALKRPAEAAIREIKSLAEESAQIRRLR